ncbi:MAG TPA: right-handed parallel beta-helix repeat-containing protein [Ktedonobacterales bacterium]
MRGNGRVFISHAHDDNARCAPLLAALDAWDVDYWFDTQQLGPGDDLSHGIQRAIAERDIFIRICTPAAQRSYWVKLETGAFRGLQARAHRAGDDTRVLINLILDAGYEPEPFDYAHIFVDATNKPQRAWLDDLRRALGIMPAGAPQPAPADTRAGPATLLVDRAAGEFATIAAALLGAKDGDRIEIAPGHYAEELALDKAVTLIGLGEPGTVVIEGIHNSTLRIEAPRVRLERLTLHQLGGRHLDCLVIARGHVEVIGCDISTQTNGAAVNITAGEEVLLRGNHIHEGGGWGVFLGGKGIVTLEDNEIVANANSGLTIMRDSYAVACRNRINGNAQYAVRIDAHAGGTFEDNDLKDNYLGAWSIDNTSFGKVLRQRNKQ